jgi:hypothetical protein
LWYSEQANKVRGLVRTCPKNCWMVGTAAPVMKKYIKHPTGWVIKNKLRSMMGKSVDIDDIPFFDVGQDARQGDLRGGRQPVIESTKDKIILSEDELADMLRVD